MLAEAEAKLSYLKIVTPKRSRSREAEQTGTTHYVYKEGKLQDGAGEVIQRIPLDQRNYTDAAARHQKLVSVPPDLM